MEFVTNGPIEPGKIYDHLEKKNSGSIVIHYGIVREKTGDRITTFIEYQRAGDVEAEMKSISDEILHRWDIEDVLIIRRVGRLEVGDIISLVAVSAPHREDAFDGCRYGVEALKKMRTVQKDEQ